MPETGTLFTDRTLAATYSRVLREAESAGGDREAQIERARKVWSQGFVAEAIDRFCRTQSLMDTQRHAASWRLTGADMAGWQASVDEPLRYEYGPLFCLQGGLEPGPVMLQQLALLKASISTISTWSSPTSSICKSSAPSSHLPIAKNSMATRISWKSDEHLALGCYNKDVGNSSPTKPRWNCSPARSPVSARW